MENKIEKIALKDAPLKFQKRFEDFRNTLKHNNQLLKEVIRVAENYLNYNETLQKLILGEINPPDIKTFEDLKFEVYDLNDSLEFSKKGAIFTKITNKVKRVDIAGRTLLDLMHIDYRNYSNAKSAIDLPKTLEEALQEEEILKK